VRPRKLGHAVLGSTDAQRSTSFFAEGLGFWYLKDPAGNFSEYYSDMDSIIDDQLWTPEDLEGRAGCSPGGRRRPRPSWRPRTSRP
jgi:catechol 2,3-dioxygenase-like lactoylglutathione lyase family enzyme